MINIWVATFHDSVILPNMINQSFDVILLDNNDRKDESIFLFGEFIFIFPD